MATRPKRTVRGRTPWPYFKRSLTESEAIAAADERLRPDNISAVGLRLALVILARSPEELMKGALTEHDGESTAIAMCKILDEVEEEFKGRLELLRAARARVLWTASYVHGI
jgi:hypothetical protein